MKRGIVFQMARAVILITAIAVLSYLGVVAMGVIFS